MSIVAVPHIRQGVTETRNVTRNTEVTYRARSTPNDEHERLKMHVFVIGLPVHDYRISIKKIQTQLASTC